MHETTKSIAVYNHIIYNNNTGNNNNNNNNNNIIYPGCPHLEGVFSGILQIINRKIIL